MVQKKISLVLGSGGARGYAHIGVIEELEKHGYEITSVSGSSMGALVGGLYACGKLQQYKEWVLGLDLLDVAGLLDFSLGKTGLIQGNKVFEAIGKIVGSVMIEDLPIAFTAVATDVIKKKEVWIQEGSLLDAIRASIAIPTVFTPKQIGGRHLVDGGILNPLPIAPTLSDNTDMTIAVKLNAQIDKVYRIDIPAQEQEKESGMQELFSDLIEKAEALIAREPGGTFDEMSMFDIVGRTIDTMQDALSDCKSAGYSPDMVIGIPKDACGFYEFNKAWEMIEMGRLIAREHLEEKEKHGQG